ncbi:MAG: TolC family protein [Planctomycetota bacterium]
MPSGQLLLVLAGMAWMLGACGAPAPDEVPRHRAAIAAIAAEVASSMGEDSAARESSLGRPQLTLKGAIEGALAASPELEQLERRIEAASEQVAAAAAAYWPQLTISESYNLTDNPVYALMNIINRKDLTPTTDFNDPGSEQDFQTKLAASWHLFDGGERGAREAGAKAARAGERAQWQAARDRLVLAATRVYFGFHRMRSIERVAETAVIAAERDLELGRARFVAGSALKSDFLRLDTRLAESRQELVSARVATRKMLAALERLLARPVGEEEIPEVAPEGISQPETAARPVDELLVQALDKRPELEAVKAFLDAANEEVRATSAKHWPQIGIEAGYQLDTERFDGMEGSWLLGAAATLTLFEGGLTSARVQAARARLREAQARGRQLALDIALEVRQAALDLSEATESLELARQRGELAAQSLEEVRRAYEVGAVTVEPLLQAELAWRRAEVARETTRFDVLVANAALAQAIGIIADELGGGVP